MYPSLKSFHNRSLFLVCLLFSIAFSGNSLAADPNSGQNPKTPRKKGPETLSLKFAFRDIRTKNPISNASGLIKNYPGNTIAPDFYFSLKKEPYNNMFLFSGDDTGQAVMPPFELNPEFHEREKLREQAKARGTEQHQLKSLEDDFNLGVVVEAPGYAIQSFALPLTLARSEKVLYFDLEPEARVRGRVLMAETGLPPTRSDLKNLIAKVSRQTKQTTPAFRVSPDPYVYLSNNSLSFSESPHYLTIRRVPVGNDGQFEVEGLHPSEQWALRVGFEETNYNHPEFPQTIQTLDIKEGVNNLGDLSFGQMGALCGKIVDEQDTPLSNVELHVPLIGLPESGWSAQSDSKGDYLLRLTRMKTPRQLVRLIPPWGREDGKKCSLYNEFESLRDLIVFDALLDLGKPTTHTLNVRLEHGAPLKIRIPSSPRMRELVRAYTRPQDSLSTPTLRYYSSQPALYGLVVQGLSPNPEGFTYCHTRYLLDSELSLETTDGEIEVKNVPPGRYAVLLLGGQQQEQPPRKIIVSPTEYNKTPHPGNMIPMAYVEYEMPTSAGEIVLQPSSQTDLEVELTRIPQGTPILTIIQLDLEQPLSTGFGEISKYIGSYSSSFSIWPVERFISPLIHYSLQYPPILAGTKPSPPPLLRLPGILPGTYHLKAYVDGRDFSDQINRPYFEKTIPIPEQPGLVRVQVPWQKRVTPPVSAPATE
jgi:hypothetical protein